ncbi:MAG: hypothetical protein JWN64_311 [Parcubacteria group bacterium]|nr:hypothetical protein [Parcubacteria group bacterium]
MIEKFSNAILYPIITLISLAAFVLFLWGIFQFVANSADEEKRSDGKMHMIWGLVGLAIIFAANSIIAIMKATVGAG